VCALGALASPPVVGQPAGRRAAVQALLDERAAAFLERDEAAFMRTVSDARPGFRARQRSSFRWAAPVRFERYSLEANWDDYGDLVRPSDRARYRRADDVALAVVEEHYRIAGFDRRDAVEQLLLTFVHEDGAWRVASDSDLAALGVFSARHLWDFGPIEQRSLGRFAIMRHRCGSRIGCAPLSDDLLPLAREALERVDLYWRAPWDKRVLFLAPTTSRELGRILQATFDLDSFVAFAYSTVVEGRDLEYGGHRVLLDPTNFSGRSSESALTILTHELLHIATRPLSGPFHPAFVEEGVAEVVAQQGDPSSLSDFDASVVGAGGFDGRLPEDYEFLTGSSTDIFTSYQKSQSAMAFFVERFGWGPLIRFYRRLGEPALAPGMPDYHVDRALRASIGMGLNAFERAWADSITSP
jgi:hypothetical protein